MRTCKQTQTPSVISARSDHPAMEKRLLLKSEETEDKLEPDPQLLLPEELRATWAVVPRDSLYQLFLVACLLGAGTSLSIVGFIRNDRLLWYGLPVALALAWLQKHVIPWSESKLLRDLEGRLPRPEND